MWTNAGNMSTPRSSEAGIELREPVLGSLGSAGDAGAGGPVVNDSGCSNVCCAGLQRLSSKYNYTLVLCMLSTMFLFADQNLMAPNLSAIAEELNIAQEDRDARLGGDVSVAFFAVGGPIGLFAGWYTDRLPRNKMYGIVTCIGAIGCFFSSLVTTHVQLLCARALTGVSIGGASPILFSILADMFPVEKRNLITAIVGFSMSIGAMSGQILSGAIASYSHTYWKLPFLIISIPTFMCGVVVFVSTKDPPRASQEAIVRQQMDVSELENGVETEAEEHPYFALTGEPSQNVAELPTTAYHERVSWDKIKGLFAVKSNLFLFLQGIPGCVPWGVFGQFMNDYLNVERGASVIQATIVVVCFGIGEMVGKILGGSLGQHIYNQRKRNVCLLMGSTTILGTLPFIYLVHAPFHTATFCVVAILGGCIAAVTGGNIAAMVLNVNLPEMRGVANGIFGLTADVGRGFGPFLIALLELGVGGRQTAFTISGLLWVLCGVLILCMYFTCEEDEAFVQRHVRGCLLKR